ncbi:MAG TPA: hypothetical protein VHX38_25825 [Pseudonocardiaceae bacterium]|jgi:hypothetical protein|nr:hypothetical protein [Pseudonocardiaceae bacterium]
MTEQYPGNNAEQPATPDAERLAQLEAALAEAQEKRHEAEHLRSKLRLWQAIEQRVLTDSIDTSNVTYAKRLLQLPGGDFLELLGNHTPVAEQRPNINPWEWSATIRLLDKYAVSPNGEITPPPEDDTEASLNIAGNFSDQSLHVTVNVTDGTKEGKPFYDLSTEGIDGWRSLVESGEPINPTVYGYED